MTFFQNMIQRELSQSFISGMILSYMLIKSGIHIIIK